MWRGEGVRHPFVSVDWSRGQIALEHLFNFTEAAFACSMFLKCVSKVASHSDRSSSFLDGPILLCGHRSCFWRPILGFVFSAFPINL